MSHPTRYELGNHTDAKAQCVPNRITPVPFSHGDLGVAFARIPTPSIAPKGPKQNSPGQAQRRSRQASPWVAQRKCDRSRWPVSIRARATETETARGLFRSRPHRHRVGARTRSTDEFGSLRNPRAAPMLVLLALACPGLICYSPFRAKWCRFVRTTETTRRRRRTPF